MRLTIDEFKILRSVQWASRVSDDNRIYYTPFNVISNILFNLDMLRNIFITKFFKQDTVNTIDNFDATVPIILRPDLTIELPTILETAIFFAEQKQNRKTFTLSTKMSLTATSVMTIIIYVCIIIFVYLTETFSTHPILRIFTRKII